MQVYVCGKGENSDQCKEAETFIWQIVSKKHVHGQIELMLTWIKIFDQIVTGQVRVPDIFV